MGTAMGTERRGWRRRDRAAGLVFTVTVVALLMAAGCAGGDVQGSSPAPTSATPTKGGVLRVGLQAETSGFKPTADQWFSSGYLVASAVYDRLMAYDENGELRPYLAQSLDSNAEYTEWRIGLRPGVRFHDGNPMNAEAVKANLDASKASPLVSQVIAPIDSITVLDELTVLVRMSSPWSTFPHALTFQPGYMASPSTLQDPDGGRHPIGTGPFAFEEWVQDDHLTVTRNNDYWRPDLPLLDGIEYRVLSDPTTKAASLRSGDVDLIESRNADTLSEFDDRGAGGEPYRVYVNGQGENTEHAIFFNTGKPPFDDPMARQAVAAAIDKEAISQTAYGGRFPPASGPFKTDSPWYRDIEFQQHDPELAKRLADDYESSSGERLSFALLTTPDSEATVLAQLVQQMVGAAGIEMAIDAVDSVALIGRGLAGNYDAGVIDQLWGSQHPDREFMLLRGDNALAVGSLALNFTRYKSAEVDAGLAQARSSGEPDGQATGWARVQRALAENFVWSFLVHDDVGDVATSAVRDVTDWTFPDGTPGLPQEGTLVSLHQIWMERGGIADDQ